MSLKINLKRKIEINALTRTVLHTVGPPGSLKKVDKTAMKRLLSIAAYEETEERGMTLFFKPDASGKLRILVLDNELPLYQTSIEDVAMRKNPTVKEIISIRNAIKIVNDSDVVTSRREESVEAIQKECVAELDLSVTRHDLDEIEQDGLHALEAGESEGVIESLSLFGELLEFETPARLPKTEDIFLQGRIEKSEDNAILFGPAVLYFPLRNDLRLFEGTYTAPGSRQAALTLDILTGGEKASSQGADVFHYLKKSIPVT